MFLMKKFLEEQNADDSDDTSSFDYEKCKKKCSKKTTRRNRTDKESRNNACLMPNFDDRLGNYKQRYHQRITLGRNAGVFPNAICTNVFSKRRDRNINHEVNGRVERKAENFRREKRNREKGELNRIIGRNETEISMEVDSPRVSPCPIDLEPFPNGRRLFETVGAAESPRNADKMTETSEGLDRGILMADAQNSIEVSNTTNIDDRGLLQFRIYKKEEAQSILMYEELGKMLNETMIIQKVTCFDCPEDMTQILQDKLWKIRASRDEQDFDPNDTGTSTLSGVNGTDSCDYDDQKLNSRRDEIQFKFVGKKNENRMRNERTRTMNDRRYDDDDAVDRTETNRRNYSYFGDTREKRTTLKTQTNWLKSVDNILPFNSCVVPTVKIGENLSMNAIEYLENLSKKSDDEADYCETASLNELAKPSSKEIQFVSSPAIFTEDFEMSFDDKESYFKSKARRRRDEQFQRMDDDDQPFYSQAREPHLRRTKSRIFEEFEARSKRNSTAKMGASQNRTPSDEPLKSLSQNVDCLLALPITSKTPEMKFYPHRLY